MSLSHFVERPALRAAFKKHSAKVRLPFDPAATPVLAPSCGRHHSAVGTAFDYVARFRIARDAMRGAPGVEVFDPGWVAETSVEMMRGHQRLGRHHARWSFLIEQARALHDDYVAGRDVPEERVARCAQYLGAADLLFRIGDFNPNFQARDEVTAELLALGAAFDPLAALRPRGAVLLNPVLRAGDCVEGADADLVVDSTIVDIKTTQDIGVSPAHLRQLAGYAVLMVEGGAEVGRSDPWRGACERVGVYFSRHGALASWSLDEIFPGDGFDRFAEAFRAEAEVFRAESAAPSPVLASPFRNP